MGKLWVHSLEDEIENQAIEHAELSLEIFNGCGEVLERVTCLINASESHVGDMI